VLNHINKNRGFIYSVIIQSCCVHKLRWNIRVDFCNNKWFSMLLEMPQFLIFQLPYFTMTSHPCSHGGQNRREQWKFRLNLLSLGMLDLKLSSLQIFYVSMFILQYLWHYIVISPFLCFVNSILLCFSLCCCHSVPLQRPWSLKR
jgi:hypothetical protein